jgi:hypothetical protein
VEVLDDELEEEELDVIAWPEGATSHQRAPKLLEPWPVVMPGFVSVM